MPAAVRLRRHGQPHARIMTWLGYYDSQTPGLLLADNASIRLDWANEPQPDAALMIDPAHGGQARISEDDYIEGAPELAAEVASSSASYDLGDKLQVFQRAGVREHLVWRVLDAEMDWFRLQHGHYEQLRCPADNIHRSEVFPGLWLDSDALMRGDMARVIDVVKQGTSSKEHAEFVRQLR